MQIPTTKYKYPPPISVASIFLLAPQPFSFPPPPFYPLLQQETMYGRRMDMYDLLADLMSGRGGGRGGYGSFRDPYDDGGGINRESFAPVSQRAMTALEDAKRIFLAHLGSVDTSNGAVSTRLINFHLVTDMRRDFKKFAKDHGCSATSSPISRAEQDVINKSRKSLLHFTSVTVTPEAQRDYFAKNPNLPKPAAATLATLASGSMSAATSTASTSAASSSGPLRDVAAKKWNRKLNEAAMAQAAIRSAVKKLNKKKA
ncbi:hypothetical protein B0H34DRAFT_728264 [Crassisporium funariophilum]|nr:hypothetical protein B0H34DRAFT_728264 [Crassisporium funariophilum]